MESYYKIIIKRDSDKDWGFGEVYNGLTFIEKNEFMYFDFNDAYSQFTKLVSYIKETLRIKEYYKEVFEHMLDMFEKALTDTTKNFISVEHKDYWLAEDNFLFVDKSSEHIHLSISDGNNWLDITIRKVNLYRFE